MSQNNRHLENLPLVHPTTIDYYKDDLIFFKATGSQKKFPCIIVQGGGYCSAISEHVEKEKYERVTKEAAKTGYAELMKVSILWSW